MKLNNQIFLSTLLICFALVGKCASTPSLFSFFTPSTPSSAPTPSSSSSKLFSSSSPTPSSSPSLFPSLSSPTPSPNEGRKTKTTTSYPPEASQFTDTPFTMSPSDAPSPSDGGSFSDFFKGTSKTKYNQGLVQICGKTHHPDVCLASISPLLKHKFDVVHVLQAAITVCTQHIKMSIAGIEKQAAASGASGEISAALTDCKGHYTKALASLQKAMEAIHSRNFGTVTIMLSGVLADVSSAESKIEDLKVSNLKVDSYSFVSIAASNCLSIASLIRT